MQTRLFTIVLDYLGGTYISQFRSGSLQLGLKLWAAGTTQQNLNFWKLERTDIESLAEQEAIPIEGLANTFCVSTTSEQGELILGHVIGTIE